MKKAGYNTSIKKKMAQNHFFMDLDAIGDTNFKISKLNTLKRFEFPKSFTKRDKT